jgi:hypothetical protein
MGIELLMRVLKVSENGVFPRVSGPGRIAEKCRKVKGKGGSGEKGVSPA